MKKLILASLLIITNAFAQLTQNWSPNFPAETADAYRGWVHADVFEGAHFGKTLHV